MRTNNPFTVCVNKGREISTIIGFFVIAHTSTGASRKRIRRYLGNVSEIKY
jgi:hypothetical protein